MPDQPHYKTLIRDSVAAKWPSHDDRRVWYAKHTGARRRKLAKLWEAQSGLCVFCQTSTWVCEEGCDKPRTPPGFFNKQMATLEHRQPQSQGGTDSLANLVMSCLGCNGKRGTIPYDDFMELSRDPEKMRAHVQAINANRDRNRADRKARSQLRRAHTIWRLAILKLTLQRWPPQAYSG